MALCFVLQAWFGWKLLGCFEGTRAFWVRLFGTGLFAFSPPLMIRVSGHSALCGHWLILAGIYLYLERRERLQRVAWPLLALTASLVHSYLFVMVLALWFASATSRLAVREIRLPSLLFEAAVVTAVSLLGLWQAGFFMVAVDPIGGYGHYGANLLTLANPDIYSHVIAPIAPPFRAFHEGYNFLGLGCLLLVPMTLPTLLARPHLLRADRKYGPLVVVLVCLSIFAITNRVSIGTFTFTVPVPDALLGLANVLRSSGRMFWPTFYVIVLALVVLLARCHGPRISAGLLALALVAQVLDTSEGWSKHHEHFAGTRTSSWATPLISPFWRLAGEQYHRLRVVPVTHHAEDYAILAYYAASYEMATDSVYLARIDPNLLRAAREQAEQTIVSGDYERDTLYILDRPHAARAESTIEPGSDLLTFVDGYFVLAPDWKSRMPPGAPSPPPVDEHEFAVAPALEHEVFFGKEGDGIAYLREGWSEPEPWGVWADQERANLMLSLEGHGVPAELDLEVGALVAPAHPNQIVECWINGTLATILQFDADDNTSWRHVALPADAARAAKQSGVLNIEFRMRNSTSPKAAGLNDDTRQLGLALHRLKLSTAL
jgi:hypothetical protein